MVKEPLLILSLTFLTQIPCSRETRRKVGGTSKREACNFGKTEEITWTNKTLNGFLHYFYFTIFTRFGWPNISLLILDCPQLWQPLQAFDSTALIANPFCRQRLQAVDNFDSCCKESTVLTAFTSYYQLWQLLQVVRSLHSSLMQLKALIAKKMPTAFTA